MKRIFVIFLKKNEFLYPVFSALLSKILELDIRVITSVPFSNKPLISFLCEIGYVVTTFNP